MAVVVATPPASHVSLATLKPTLDTYPLGKVVCEVMGKSVTVVAIEGNVVVIAEVRPNDGTYFSTIEVENLEKIDCIDPR